MNSPQPLPPEGPEENNADAIRRQKRIDEAKVVFHGATQENIQSASPELREGYNKLAPYVFTQRDVKKETGGLIKIMPEIAALSEGNDPTSKDFGTIFARHGLPVSEVTEAEVLQMIEDGELLFQVDDMMQRTYGESQHLITKDHVLLKVYKLNEYKKIIVSK